MTIISYHHVHLRLYACARACVCVYTRARSRTLYSCIFGLLIARVLVCSLPGSIHRPRRYTLTDYPQNVPPHYDYVTLRSRCSWHVRSSSALYVIGKRVRSFRCSYFLYARWGTAALPIDYRDLIFLPREILLNAPLPYFLSSRRAVASTPRKGATGRDCYNAIPSTASFVLHPVRIFIVLRACVDARFSMEISWRIRTSCSSLRTDALRCSNVSLEDYDFERTILNILFNTTV